MKALTESTFVPLGIAIIAIGGGAIWLTNVYAQVKESNVAIERLGQKQEEYNKLVIEINGRLSRIEWKLETTKESRK